MNNIVVLTRDWDYWGETSLRRVINKWLKKRIEIIASNGSYVKLGNNDSMAYPLIVRLLDFSGYKCKSEKIIYSTNEVYQRDGFYCQYWHYDSDGKRFRFKCNLDNITKDHVIPVCRGGVSSFSNVVTSCRNCNEILKKDKTPKEAGLELIRQPFTPTRVKGSKMYKRFLFNHNFQSHIEFINRFPKYAEGC